MKLPDVLRKFFDLTGSQKNRVIRIVNDMANLKGQLAGIEPKVCTKCHCSNGFTIAGFEHIKHTGGNHTGNPYATKQIYRCRSCGKRFVCDSGTMTHNLKITQEEFVEICKDAILCVPMKKTAERLNRSVQCVFEKHPKFLCFLGKGLGEETEKPAGTVEVDETYVLSLRMELDPSNVKHAEEAKPATTKAFPMSRFVSLLIPIIMAMKCINQQG